MNPTTARTRGKRPALATATTGSLPQRMERLAEQAESVGQDNNQDPDTGYMYGYAAGLRRAADMVRDV